MSKSSALEAGLQQQPAREVRAGKEEAKEGVAAFNLDYKLLLLGVGQTHEEDRYTLFDPKSTPLYASHIVQLVEAAIRPGADPAMREDLLEYLSDKMTLADHQAKVARLEAAVAASLDPVLARRMVDQRGAALIWVHLLKEHLPAWLLALSRAELGTWETWLHRPARGIEGPVIFRLYEDRE